MKLCRAKPSLKRERSWSPPPRDYIPKGPTPAKALSKKERKAQRKQEHQRSSYSEQYGNALQDDEREQARARRFGNGSAMGSVSSVSDYARKVGSLLVGMQAMSTLCPADSRVNKLRLLADMFNNFRMLTKVQC